MSLLILMFTMLNMDIRKNIVVVISYNFSYLHDVAINFSRISIFISNFKIYEYKYFSVRENMFKVDSKCDVKFLMRCVMKYITFMYQSLSIF